MKKHNVKILESFFVTHDVKSFIVERPEDYMFEPGQATEVSINKNGWKEEKRPFTFTNLPEDNFLQFIIKSYPEHKGVTKEIHTLNVGDELILHDVFGTITYQRKGLFIAGGAGITPFISIFRNLKKTDRLIGNRLIFANKTKEDIILQKELGGLFGNDFINILSEENHDDFQHGTVTKDFLKKNMNERAENFYVCGPEPMNEAVIEQLTDLGITQKSIIKEGL
ncbi:MAG: flavodoxin reductase [Bacteroidetes bacterium]|nr:flavodoxin reductase [Bacteroidota bacterium]